MKRHTNAAFKKMAKNLVHISTADDDCKCKLCLKQANGTYLEGLVDATNMFKSAILNDEAKDRLTQ